MRSQLTINRLFLLLVFAAMFAGASLAAAQEAVGTTADVVTAPEFQGVSTLMLLLGLAAVAAVGLVWFLRERSASDSDETQ